MKRSIVVFCSLMLAVLAVSAHAQVAPSATSHRTEIYAGGEVSFFQPDYAGQGVAQSSPQKLVGIGAYVDADFTRWIQIEAEGRWLHWNELMIRPPTGSSFGIYQNTYMIGPRVPVGTFKGFTPYGKFLIGWASMTELSGRATAWTYGGGVDYQLSRKISVRCFDFEYQQWRVAPTLHPYGGSVGLSYRIF
ncbi:MAG: porin family protein [Acidobacteriota bacterium]